MGRDRRRTLALALAAALVLVPASAPVYQTQGQLLPGSR